MPNLGHQLYDGLTILWICIAIVWFLEYCDDLFNTGVLLFVALSVGCIDRFWKFSEVFRELEREREKERGRDREEFRLEAIMRQEGRTFYVCSKFFQWFIQYLFARKLTHHVLKKVCKLCGVVFVFAQPEAIQRFQ